MVYGIDTLNGSCYKAKFSKNGPGNGEVAEWLKAPLSKSGILAKIRDRGFESHPLRQGILIQAIIADRSGLNACGTER